MKKIDLHTHTNFSDGLLTPKELLKKAKSYKLKAIAVCDHDTIKAYKDKNIFNYAKKIDVELVPGIEFSTVDDKKTKYHILGLFIDLKNKKLNKLINNIQNKRTIYAKKVCELLRKDGWFINIDKLLLKNKSITKVHISRLLLSNKKNQAKIKKLFKKKPSEGEITETLLIKGKKYFILNVKQITPKNAIDIIHASQGIAILAHPGFNVMNGEKLNNLCDKFKSLGIDGFEAINIQYDKKRNDKRIDYVKEFKKYSKKHNMLITGGSDFHHSNKKLMGKFIDLGFKNDIYSVSYSIISKLKKFKKNKALSSNS